MKKTINAVHIISGLIPLLFSICLLALFFGESARKGGFPDTITEEATPNFLRSVTTLLLPIGQISIIVCFLLLLIRFFFWKSNNPSKKETIFLFVSLASMIVIVYFNPWHLFTWMMG